MPAIMTMNGDHQSIATTPLDLRTTNRERGGAGPRSPECGLERLRQGRSPEPPTGTTSSLCPVTRSVPDSGLGASRKRSMDSDSHKLPFRKRRILVEPETETQPPAPTVGGDRLSSQRDEDLASREHFAGRLERAADGHRVGVAPVTPRRIEEAQQSPDRCAMHLLRAFPYGHYPVYYLPPEQSLPLVHQTDNLMVGIALATHQDEDGDTALHIAVVQGQLAVVNTLIHLLQWARKSVDIYNNLRQTPLHLAVITQQAKMVDILLRAGADPAALDRNGQTALHLCCEYNHGECLSIVLSWSLSSMCLESRNYEGLSPLHLAVLLGHKNLARMLLGNGADVNAMDIKSGQSPLMHAVESNNTDMVHFLIENGCDVNNQSYSGNTALHGACGRGQVDTVRLLLKSGADSSLKNYHNDTPVMVAKNKKIADVLRGRGSKHIRVQDQHSNLVSPQGSNSTENGSPSPSQSCGCSPSTTPHTSHHGAPHSPKTPSMSAFPLY